MTRTSLIALALIACVTQANADDSLGIDRGQAIQSTKIRHSRIDANGNVIGGAPSGCPSTRFCGCALALKVFGRHDRTLWPARAWFRFPRTVAQDGAVAVTGRHVFLLLSHVEGTRWTVFDPNSGGHLTRIHERDIRGTTIVDPRGSRVASK